MAGPASIQPRQAPPACLLAFLPTLHLLSFPPQEQRSTLITARLKESRCQAGENIERPGSQPLVHLPSLRMLLTDRHKLESILKP